MLNRNSLGAGIAAMAVLFSVALNNHALGMSFQPGEFVTYSQESWGAVPAPGNAAQLLVDGFDGIYGGGVEVGISGNGGFSMIFTNIASLLNYLPASGSPGPLNSDLIDPTSTPSGLFGGGVMALQFNVDFNDAGLLTGSSGILFGDLVLRDLVTNPVEDLTVFNGLTVRQFLAEMNIRLGGGEPFTYDAVAALTEDLTLAFEGGTPSQFAQDHLTVIPAPAAVWGGLATLGWLGLVRRPRRPRRSAGAAA